MSIAHLQELQKLLKTINTIREAVSKLEQRSRGKLNKITVNQCWKNFDTEAFAGIVQDMIEILPTLAPARIANDARSAIIEGILPKSYDRDVREIKRRGRPALVELWETIPASTRIQTEKFVRRLPPDTSVIAFFRQLEAGAAALVPRPKDGRSPARVKVFARGVAKIWARLGLHVGRAYDGVWSTERDSPVQSFCGHALAAVGDQSRVSRRQVCNIQLACLGQLK
jgi:hypothetical protein